MNFTGSRLWTRLLCMKTIDCMDMHVCNSNNNNRYVRCHKTKQKVGTNIAALINSLRSYY